jgi:hypothetical protein
LSSPTPSLFCMNSGEWINSLSTIQVNSGELLYCLLRRTSPAQPKMIEPSLAQSKNNFKKILLKKICWFSHVCFY